MICYLTKLINHLR